MNRLLLALAAVLALVACKPGPKAAAPMDAAASAAAAKAFMDSNGKKPGVVTLPSGVQYKVVHSGPAGGVHPGLNDEVKVHYELKLLNGEVIDSSFERGAPEVMDLRSLVGAWKLTLPEMRPGDEWTIWAPPALGYGDEDKGPIPANSVLEFRVQLIDVLPEGGVVGRG
ncbi:peptidylprolyl isomerase/FKBP-type peptidyl-prolyl cis-trans isomerase FklB [Caulobacter ginsengisoli]|uniref:Peptidyl-prolyl cis-trans isomerase n=1 Tax=Caulobacter ginsengisoli TaxID=400775 RepID=A0ABU0ITX1_9CAUL|nr:FKBP-type peptidyl-prolyl cis-trans isomerase [Caulobacter ginsengisoli]MDQ0465453.1 peptidylprolyl isomerase/FKBP-type peptidyl-prolyl cis-trans isomerase FklB [Caulobacter ginsengisoli]